VSEINKVIYQVGTSADGFIARVDGGIDWLTGFDPNNYGFDSFMKGVGAVVVGANTYRQMLAMGEWPYQMPTYVATRQQSNFPAAPGVHFVNGNPKHFMAEIRTATDGTVFLLGGAQLAGSCFRAGAVDEIVITALPLLIGSGIPLSRDTGRDVNLVLTGLQNFDDGVVQSTYKVEM